MAHKNQGFTLLELAVLLMVIGLIIAGIMIGRTMIRQGEIRNVLGEEDHYIKAIKEFQDKYMALPGDMKTAESIWGSDTNCPYTTSDTVLKAATCNGNGSGTIGNSDVMAHLSVTTEWWRAWQQLADAHLIAGRYTGTIGPHGVTEAMIGINAPVSDLDTAGWTLLYYLLDCNGDLWSDQYGHILSFGSYQTNDFTRGPALYPSEALALDQKIDDGKPGTGKVRTWRPSYVPNFNCTINDTTQTGETYNTAYGSNAACSMVFLLGF